MCQVRVQRLRFFAIAAADDLLGRQHGRVGPPIFQQHQFNRLRPFFQWPAEITLPVTAGRQEQQADTIE